MATDQGGELLVAFVRREQIEEAENFLALLLVFHGQRRPVWLRWGLGDGPKVL